ncbi:unnamed protein product [Nippostrongylus brasiliensis]|uniref:Uncharacterized protein n=1 Tax=Nippostrongylus brasiliensis TaxID=27835 RepID=A0A0N4YKB1_NIPBR|nr:unnamed protein product [Nippostrongylus brasiliensis]
MRWSAETPPIPARQWRCVQPPTAKSAAEMKFIALSFCVPDCPLPSNKDHYDTIRENEKDVAGRHDKQRNFLTFAEARSGDLSLNGNLKETVLFRMYQKKFVDKCLKGTTSSANYEAENFL